MALPRFLKHSLAPSPPPSPCDQWCLSCKRVTSTKTFVSVCHRVNVIISCNLITSVYEIKYLNDRGKHAQATKFNLIVLLIVLPYSNLLFTLRFQQLQIQQIGIAKCCSVITPQFRGYKLEFQLITPIIYFLLMFIYGFMHLFIKYYTQKWIHYFRIPVRGEMKLW